MPADVGPAGAYYAFAIDSPGGPEADPGYVAAQISEYYNNTFSSIFFLESSPQEASGWSDYEKTLRFDGGQQVSQILFSFPLDALCFTGHLTPCLADWQPPSIRRHWIDTLRSLQLHAHLRRAVYMASWPMEQPLSGGVRRSLPAMRQVAMRRSGPHLPYHYGRPYQPSHQSTGTTDHRPRVRSSEWPHGVRRIVLRRRSALSPLWYLCRSLNLEGIERHCGVKGECRQGHNVHTKWYRSQATANKASEHLSSLLKRRSSVLFPSDAAS